MNKNIIPIIRKELKFIIPEYKLNNFYYWINSKKNIFPIYKTRLVNSLYYDNVNFKSASDNIVGLADREKFRIRWYGNLPNSKVNFEVKKKKNFYTNKIILNTELIYSNIDLNNFLTLNSPLVEIYKENFIKLIKNDLLLPILETGYKRSYYVYSNIRLTFDSNIKYKLYNSNNYREDKDSILEIKFENKNHGELKNLLSDLNFIVSRNSKYLKGLGHFNLMQYN